MPNRKVVMEDGMKAAFKDYIDQQHKVDQVFSKSLDKIIDYTKSQSKVILAQADQIKNLQRNIKGILYIQLGTALCLLLVHIIHAGYLDNVGWLQ